jgi:hypothetical protein
MQSYVLIAHKDVDDDDDDDYDDDDDDFDNDDYYKAYTNNI